MKKSASIILLFIFFSIGFYAGCKDTITGKELDNKVIPSSNVSYSEYIQPVFNLKCNNSGCHEDATRAGGLSLTTWAGATADPGVVFPGEPNNSRLVWAIQRKAGVQPKPPLEYPPHTQNQVDGIVTWIKEGAKNN